MYRSTLILLVVVLLVSACRREGIDKEKPQINNSFSTAFPVNCDTLYFGDTVRVKLRFTDNAELGTYSIDIHNNFDHHSHSTEFSDCNPDPDKTPIHPYTFIDDYALSPGLKEFETELSLTIPDSHSNGQYDEGDYHFSVSLTDKEGWSAQKGISIKLLYR